MGSFLLIVGVIGLCGARSETRLALLCFCVLLGMLFFALLVIGAWILSKTSTGQGTYNLVYSFFINMQASTILSITESYQCCGANVFGDVPSCVHDFSCCTPVPGSPGTYYHASCVPLLVPAVKSAYLGFGIVGIFLAVACLSGIISAYCLMGGIATAVEKETEEKKAKKLEKLEKQQAQREAERESSRRH